jgi:hypothetical protein
VRKGRLGEISWFDVGRILGRVEKLFEHILLRAHARTVAGVGGLLYLFQ